MGETSKLEMHNFFLTSISGRYYGLSSIEFKTLETLTI